MELSYIRRVIIGSDYKNAMNYIVGQNVGEKYKILSILPIEGGSYQIWIVDANGTQLLWKLIGNTVPVIAEFNLEF